MWRAFGGWLLLAITTPLFARPLEWQAFRNFTSADGLPQNSILALAQDDAGRVYAGTGQGLARYDGLRWSTVELPTGARAYAVGALAVARDGALWVGTDEAGAWRVDGADKQRLDLPGAQQVDALWEGPDASMWVASSEGGLYRCLRLRCERIGNLAEVGARGLYGERIDGQWRLWVGTNLAGVIQFTGIDGPRPVRSGVVIDRSMGLPNNVGLSMVRHRGDLWIGSGRGLARWDGTRVESWTVEHGLPNAMVFALRSDTDERGEPLLYAALRPGGLLEIRADGRWRLIDSAHGLPSNAVHSLLRERLRGALWVGTLTAGIARVEHERWALFDERMGLPDRIVLGVGWSPRGDLLWAGTAGGAVRWDGERFAPLLPPPFDRLLVHDLLDAPDGSRWIAHRGGLQRWRDGRLEREFTADNSRLPAVSAERLALRRVGDGYELYIGTGHGLGRWRGSEGAQSGTSRSGSPQSESRQSESMQSIVAGVVGIGEGRAVPAIVTTADSGGGDDILWAASDEGLARLDRTGWQQVGAACLDRLGPLAIDVQTVGAGTRVWVATRNGLRRVDDDGACVAYPAVASLGALSGVRVVGDEVYVFGARGVMRLRADGAAAQAEASWGAEAGLVSPEISAMAVDGRGRLFGATNAGLAAFEPHRVAPMPPAPLRLLAAHYGAASRVLERDAELPPDDSGVRFDYALFAFDREYATRYRVRLLGLDEFGAWSADPQASYARLPPGRYRLQVEARDADGVAAAAPIDFPFTVAAHWWQRAWAWALAALALLAAGVGLDRWRARAAGRRAAALEAEVALRTRELAAANERLEQAAVTDPLTGLKNRRYFALAAPAEVERAHRAPAGQALLIALLDVDHFKRINDGHGHDVGDAVLVEVAQRLLHVARAGDFVLRWGGEEFLLLLRDVEPAAADETLRRVLHRLADAPIVVDGHALRVTASIGALVLPSPGEPAMMDIEQAITRADAALYRAKREGRNRAMRVDARHGSGEPPCLVVE